MSMNVRNRLVELLESAESAVYWSSSDKDFIEKIADHLIENGVTMQKWISVKDGLPERMQPVIVCREDKKVEQGYRDVNDWWKVYGTRTKRVTHWMPLPEPPKGD